MFFVLKLIGWFEAILLLLFVIVFLLYISCFGEPKQNLLFLQFPLPLMLLLICLASSKDLLFILWNDSKFLVGAWLFDLWQIPSLTFSFSFSICSFSLFLFFINLKSFKILFLSFGSSFTVFDSCSYLFIVFGLSSVIITSLEELIGDFNWYSVTLLLYIFLSWILGEFKLIVNLFLWRDGTSVHFSFLSFW